MSKSPIDYILENARRDLDLDFKVSGGDRTKKRNKEVGGSKRSKHIEKGGARDISVKNLSDADRKKLKNYMVERGYKSLDETSATRGTGEHLHFDTSPDEKNFREANRGIKMEKPFFGDYKYNQDKDVEDTIKELKTRKSDEKTRLGLADLLKVSDTSSKPKTFSEAFEEEYEKNPGGTFNWEGRDILLKKADEVPTNNEELSPSLADKLAQYAARPVETPIEMDPIQPSVDNYVPSEDSTRINELMQRYSNHQPVEFTDVDKFADGGTVNVDELLRRKQEMEDQAEAEAAIQEQIAQESVIEQAPTPVLEAPVAPEIAPEPVLAPEAAPTPTAPEFDHKAKLQALYGKYQAMQDTPSADTSIWSKIGDIGGSLGNLGNKLAVGGPKLKFTSDRGAKELAAGGKSKAEKLKLMKSQMDVLKELNGGGTKGRNEWRIATLEDDAGVPTAYRVNTRTGEKEKLGTKGYSNRLVKDAVTGEYIDPRGILRGTGDKKTESKYGKGTYGDLTANQRDELKDLRATFKKETEDIRASYDKIAGLNDAQIELAVTNPVAAGQLGAQVATIFENGRLTDEDVVRYTRRSGIPDKISDTLLDLKNGTISNSKASEIRESLKLFEKVLSKQINNRAMGEAKIMEENYGIPAEKLVKNIYSQYKEQFSKSEEKGIKKVMKKNDLSRGEAIAALRSAGKL